MIFLFIIILLISEPIAKLLMQPFFILLVFRLFLPQFQPESITFFCFPILLLFMLQSKLIICFFFVRLTLKLLILISGLVIEIFLRLYLSNFINVLAIIKVLFFFKLQLNLLNQLEFWIFLMLNLFVVYQHKPQLII